jgi:SAM-dependent methyltransferase
MTDSVWVDMDDEIQKQLSLQVDLSLQRHHEFMIEHGLELCQDVVDVGTGSGRFLEGIAGQHPVIKFHGVDNKPHMVRAAETIELPNLDWLHADALDSQTANLLCAADGVLMRYFILHLPDTAASVREMLVATKPGTRLWVFDLDIDHCSCVPEASVFNDFVALVRKFCEQSGVKIRTGELLPPILDTCGFEVRKIIVEPFNNREVDNSRFTEYLLREASLYHYLLYGTLGTSELAPLREFLESSTGDASQFVQYGMVMLSAVKRPF